MVQTTRLRPKDLQPGDSIRVTFTERGALTMREGTFGQATNFGGLGNVYLTTEGGVLFVAEQAEEIAIELLHRDGDEPTGLGAVIVDRDPDRGEVHYVHLGDHVWAEAGVPTRVFAWGHFAAPSVKAEGWKP